MICFAAQNSTKSTPLGRGTVQTRWHVECLCQTLHVLHVCIGGGPVVIVGMCPMECLGNNNRPKPIWPGISLLTYPFDVDNLISIPCTMLNLMLNVMDYLMWFPTDTLSLPWCWLSNTKHRLTPPVGFAATGRRTRPAHLEECEFLSSPESRKAGQQSGAARELGLHPGDLDFGRGDLTSTGII